MDHTQTPPPVNAITHPACGQWWTGLSRAHCPACCRTFSTDSAADKHRIGRHGIDRRCTDPAEVGLVARKKPYGVLWAHPGPDGGYAALHAPTPVFVPASVTLAAQYTADGNEMAASLARDGFGADEITEILNHPTPRAHGPQAPTTEEAR